MKIRILTAADVKAALPMIEAIRAMSSAFGQLSAGQTAVPLRSRVATDKGVTLCMPAYLSQSRDLGVKIVSIYGGNPELGLPSVSALVLVLDPQSGLPRAMMDGTSLTAIRTGAGGGLAADLLARKDAAVVTLFGAGVQARAQLAAAVAVRDIRCVNIISRTRGSMQRLEQDIRAWHSSMDITTGLAPDTAVEGSDIVITATSSPTPLFDGHALKPGTHVTGVGSFTPKTREVDETTVSRAKVVVDSRDACLEEAGDIIISGASIYAELGEIVNGEKKGRISEDEITFFKSVGVAVQDAAAAAAVIAEAEKKGMGTLVEL